MMSNPTNESLVITQALCEITVSLKQLEKSVERNQNKLSELVESKAEHSVGIKYLTSGMERFFGELKTIDTRIARVETILETRKDSQKKRMGLRSCIVETIRDYWHVIAVVATAITYALAHYWGITIKD